MMRHYGRSTNADLLFLIMVVFESAVYVQLFTLFLCKNIKIDVALIHNDCVRYLAYVLLFRRTNALLSHNL